MEKTAKYVVIRNTESGIFLTDYQSKGNGSFAYEASYIEAIQHAASIDVESFEEQKEEMESLAKALGGEVLVVEATYNLKHLNGEEAKEIEMEPKVNGKSLFDVLREVGQEMGLEQAGE